MSSITHNHRDSQWMDASLKVPKADVQWKLRLGLKVLEVISYKEFSFINQLLNNTLN